MAAIRLNGYERGERAALLSARLAFVFAREPATRHAVAYLSPGGQLMVRGLPMARLRGKVRVIGTYGREVSIQQLIEDIETFESEVAQA